MARRRLRFEVRGELVELRVEIDFGRVSPQRTRGARIGAGCAADPEIDAPGKNAERTRKSSATLSGV
jgi:hypothetical protein